MRALKLKTVKGKDKKNTTSNIISEIQTNDPDQDTEIDENDSHSMGWNNLPDMVMTSDNSDTSDTDGTERFNALYEQNWISNLEYVKL